MKSPSLLLVGALSMFLSPAALAAQEWPQWRGPEGLGVSPDASELPVEWGPESDNIRWRSEVPGQGYSSPIVSNGRVFLTTAYEGSSGGSLKQVLRFGLAALVLAILWSTWRRRSRAGRVLIGATLLFAVLATLTVLRPELFLEAGNPGRTWRALSTLALLGAAAALFWLGPAARLRGVGAFALLAVSVYLAVGIPSGPRGAIPLQKAIAVVLPGLAASAWCLWGLLRSRKREHSGSVAIHDPWLALALVGLAALVFVPPNFAGGLQRVVVCLDLESGELLWQRAVYTASREQKSPWGSYATPTPVADGERVFAYFGSGLSALDFEGRLQWTARFPDYSGHSRYGAATSPVLEGDSVLILAESELYQDSPPTWMAAFDKRTGEVRWRVEPADAHDSYGTPLVVRNGPATQLVTASWEALLGFDAGTGERLWSYPYPMQQIASSLARSGDLVAVTGGNHGEKGLRVVRIPAAGSGREPELLWRASKGIATVVSPVIYNGILFTPTRSGILTAYEVETGEVLWKKRLDGEYFASPVAADGKIYITNTEGTTTVLEAAPEYRWISENDLPDGTYATFAIADGGFVVRTGQEVFFIEGGSR